MSDQTPRKPVRWGLILSVALNLALIGLIAGAVWRGPPERPIAGPSLWSYARALPDPHRAELRRALRQSAPDWREKHRSLGDQRIAVSAALMAEPFDPGDVRELLEGRVGAGRDLAATGIGLLMARIEAMNPSERRAYAEALAKNDDRRRSKERQDSGGHREE